MMYVILLSVIPVSFWWLSYHLNIITMSFILLSVIMMSFILFSIIIVNTAECHHVVWAAFCWVSFCWMSWHQTKQSLKIKAHETFFYKPFLTQQLSMLQNCLLLGRNKLERFVTENDFNRNVMFSGMSLRLWLSCCQMLHSGMFWP